MDSKLTRKVVFAVVAAGAVLAPTRQSQAFPVATAAAVIGFAKSAFGYFQKASKIFGPSGQDLIAQFTDAVQRVVTDALITARNTQWKTDANNVFNGFRTLAGRSAEVPDNAAILTSTLILARQTLDNFAQLVDDVAQGSSSDIESNYQLAPTYNALVVTYVALNQMMPEVHANDSDPDDARNAPLPWGEYNTYLSQAMRVNYSLVGASHFSCWPGFNPGAGNYAQSTDNNTFEAQARSQIFTKLADRDVQVGTWTGTVFVASFGGCTTTTATLAKYCNPHRGTCTRLYNGPLDSKLRCPNPSLVFPTTAAQTNQGVLSARNTAKTSWFDPDPVVQIAVAGINGFMSLGGGEVSSGADQANITLPVTGRMTDPQVPEPTCGGTAYPTVTTTALPDPAPFWDGYQQDGDFTNIFPQSEVRMQESTPVARAGSIPTVRNHNYTLVIRYRQGHASRGLLKVGLQRHDTGATEKVFNNVSFDPTPNDTWQLKRLNFSTGTSFDSTSYVRLEFLGGEITYFDAVWVIDQ